MQGQKMTINVVTSKEQAKTDVLLPKVNRFFPRASRKVAADPDVLFGVCPAVANVLLPGGPSVVQHRRAHAQEHRARHLLH
jgi:hypothetical protein